MGYIKIKSVHYSGDNYYYNSPEFTSGLNIILGRNGSGKTTLCDLIYYALGGEVDKFKKDSKEPLIEIASDTNNDVKLVIEINKETYFLKRNIGATDVKIKYQVEKENEGNEEKDKEFEDIYMYFKINRTKDDKYIFSDWLLEKLDISPVRLFDGYKSYMINFKDLSRLFYYDQETNPRKIYKSPTRDDSVSNTEFIRKVIFELLMGSNFEKYYHACNVYREAELEKNRAKALFDDYNSLAEERQKRSTINLNLIHAKAKLDKEKTTLKQLLEHRDSFKSLIYNINYDEQINHYKRNLLIDEEILNDEEEAFDIRVKELFQIRVLIDSLNVEINQLHKIIYTNEKFGLFSFNICPWCLNTLTEKPEDTCFCGNELKEDEKIIFEYNTDEYKTILKSKKKTLQTVTESYKLIDEEKNKAKDKVEAIKIKICKIKQQISRYVKEYDNPINFEKINELDGQIQECREEILLYDEYINTEEKLDSLRTQFNLKEIICKQAYKEKSILEKMAQQDIYQKITSFDKKYSELMINSLEECKKARIDDEAYMPIIDDGCYREKSASVQIRLMYFYTLLYLSMSCEEIKFPRFLLIDTPDTDGIDEENLVNAIGQLDNIKVDNEDYQVILTTWEYPEKFKDRVRGEILIKKQNYLLKKVIKDEKIKI